MKLSLKSLLLCTAFLLDMISACQELLETSQSDLQALLPRSLPWDDTRSVTEFVVEDSNPFVTPAEASNFTETATYQEVTEFFTALAAESSYVEVKSLAKLANGEDLWLVIVSGEEQFTPDSMTNPTIFATAGIHPGESSGVNAGMMLARNLVTKDDYESILQSTNFLFIPVLNIHGYLRQTPWGRINQHGPETSGRRANGEWKNLNRDFGKLDTPEIRAVVGVMNDYDISFFTDLHSTDGMNYQPDVTWCDNGDAGLSNEIYAWMRSEMQPDLEAILENDYQHKTGVCYYANDGMDPTAGYYPYFSDGAAYSGNYADHRQIPAYLLEIHSLKPNKQRVLGAYAFLLGLHKIISQKAESLRAAIDADRAARVDPVPISWDFDSPAPLVEWDIFEYEIVTNPVLGIDQIIWSDVPLTIEVNQSTRSTPLLPPKRPYAYIIPAVWEEVIHVLDMHGILMDVFTAQTTLDVVKYRMEEATFSRLREGRPEIAGGDSAVPENCTHTYLLNDILLKTDQDLGTLAVALLEPIGESSLFLWGFFASMLTSHEYPENYIMIPLAEKMLKESAELSQEWETYTQENPSYINDTDGTINWFFRRSAFYDAEAFVYPVGILYDDPSDSLPLAPFAKEAVTTNTEDEESVSTISKQGEASDSGDTSSASFGQYRFTLLFTLIVAIAATSFF